MLALKLAADEHWLRTATAPEKWNCLSALARPAVCQLVVTCSAEWALTDNMQAA